MDSEVFAVKAQSLTRDFGSLRAVDHLDLQVRRGEIYGLLGPNGSGKTTLIRLLTGILKPTYGTVSLLKIPLPNKAIMSKVGYMTQSAALYEELSVKENIVFFVSMCGATGKNAVDKVIDLIELTNRASSRVKNLSGGMKRRTSLACALVHDPKILLLDEPTVGVDPALRATFWQYFRRVVNQGVTIVVSSHVMDEAQRCDRLGLIGNGRLIAEGSHDRLMERAGAATLEEAFLHFTSESEKNG